MEIQDILSDVQPADLEWDSMDTSDIKEYTQTYWLDEPSLFIPHSKVPVTVATLGVKQEVFSSAYEINKLPVSGISINDELWNVSAPLIRKPEYVAPATLSFLEHSTFSGDTAIILPKWNGEIAIDATLYANNKVKNLHIQGGVAIITEPKRPCVGELVDGKFIAFDGVSEFHTRNFQDITDAEKDKTDGVIIRSNNTEYKVKQTRTYDLRAGLNGFYTIDDTLYIARNTTGLIYGSIYEVAQDGTVLRERPDKMFPLSHQQCVAVKTGLLSKDLMPVIENISPGYSVQYHITLYVKYLFENGLLHLPISRTAASVALYKLGMPYSVDEVVSLANKVYVQSQNCTIKYIVDNNNSEWGHREGDIYTFFIRDNGHLTARKFIDSQCWEKTSSFTAAKRYLLALGFYFTTPDLVLLYAKFIRYYDHRQFLVHTPGFFPYLLPLVPKFTLSHHESETMLPYHRATYDVGFF